MKRHTPGPWEHTGGYDGRFKGYVRAVADREHRGRYSIAKVTISKPEWEANAQLIAAAPELFEALNNLYVVSPPVEELAASAAADPAQKSAVAIFREEMEKARVAIEKAVGRKPAAPVSGGTVVYHCGHRFVIAAEMRGEVKQITLPPRECPQCGR